MDPYSVYLSIEKVVKAITYCSCFIPVCKIFFTNIDVIKSELNRGNYRIIYIVLWEEGYTCINFRYEVKLLTTE